MGMRPVSYRYDLDGLRGIAIAFVVLFHVFVGRVSGGVDVFLLLSGYFFLGSQLRYAERPDASLNPWWPLWRTARRLLPALVLVLGATLGVVAWLIPELRTPDFAAQLVASVLYYQNWELYSQGAAYGAASTTASPLQHVWSMAVQGQFYLLAIALGLLVAMVLRRRRRLSAPAVAGPVLAVATLASFGCAAWLHTVDQELNYYSTWARLWELTLGGLLALYAHRVKLAEWLRSGLAAVGLVMVLTTGFLFDGAAEFPGPAALYPLGGATLVVLGSGPVANALASRPLRRLGAWAYALYLWHWPLLIAVTVLRDEERPGVLTGCGVIVASLVLAAATHRWVEEPLRQRGRRPVRGEHRARAAWHGLFHRRGVAVRAGAGVVVAALAAKVMVSPLPWYHAVEDAERHVLDPRQYPGAGVLTGAVAPEGVEPAPDPYALPSTVNAAWYRGCISFFGQDPSVLPPDAYEEEEPGYCVFGDPDAPTTVFLVGGSHAEQWTLALDILGKQHGFAVIPFVRQSCPAFAEELDGIFSPDCERFNAAVRGAIKERKPDVVVSNSTRPLVEQGQFRDQVPRSYPSFWQFLNELDIPFIGLRDNPWFFSEDGEERSVPLCVAEGGTAEECGAPASEVYSQKDPARWWQKYYPNVHMVDIAPWLCPDEVCPAVMGNVVVYRDSNHLSDAFVRTLAPLLWQRIGPVIRPIVRAHDAAERASAPRDADTADTSEAAASETSSATAKNTP